MSRRSKDITGSMADDSMSDDVSEEAAKNTILNVQILKLHPDVLPNTALEQLRELDPSVLSNAALEQLKSDSCAPSNTALKKPRHKEGRSLTH
jgi:hypothetical protein